MIGTSIPALRTATLALALSAAGSAVGWAQARPDTVGEEGTPRQGGTLRVHLETGLTSLNGLSDNSAVTWRLLDELHEPLLRRDWASPWEPVPVLARSVEVGDLEDRPGVVWTFFLRDDVLWHDGHPFDSGDVLFSLACARNEHFRCPRRFLFDKLESAEVLGPHAVRFVLKRPYFLAADVFQSLVILPEHLFQHPDTEATDEQRARFIHEHPGNLEWVGLGPYRLVRRNDQVIEARRFEDYFDPAHGGFVDTIQWRVIRDDEAALTALLEGELDFMSRVPSADFFGERTRSEDFTAGFVKGHYYTPRMSYTVWNMARPPFDDVRVRRALGMCFDWREFVDSYYRGMALRVTSEVFAGSLNYNRRVPHLSFDLDRARQLLAEAGWYDRDGDGLVDKDGVPFEIELLAPGGRTAEVYGQKLRENLAQVGVRLELALREYGTFAERVGERDFDAAVWAWFMPVVNDPEQLWHSRWVGPHTSNHASFADETADALIEAIQVELGEDERRLLFHQLHELLYDSQAYMYGVAVPNKFAASKRIRNLELFAVEPGYSLRRWYLAE